MKQAASSSAIPASATGIAHGSRRPPLRHPYLRHGITIALLIAMAGTIVAQRLYLRKAPLYGDICAYAIIGHEMLKGRTLYSDLWERKPPLLYDTYAAAELLVGYGRQELLFLSVATALLTLGGLYCAGCAAGAGRTGGLLAAGLWTILCADLQLTANQPDPETFINACLVWAFCVIVLPWKPRPILKGLLFGSLLAAATLYKHNTALVCGALIAANAIAPRSKPTSRWFDRIAIVESIVATSVIVLAWLGVFAYFAAVGRLHDFVDVVFTQNFSYSGNIFENLVQSLQPDRFFPQFMYWAIGPIALVALFAGLSIRHADRRLLFRRKWLIWLAWAIGAWATIAVTGYLYPHYYELWLPVWCGGGAWAGAALLGREFPGPRLLRVGFVTAVLLVLVFRQAVQFQLTPQQWVQRQFPYFNFANLQQVSIELKHLLKPNESFWELGEDNSIYFNTGHSPPVGLLYIDPLIRGNDRPSYWHKLMNDLHRSRPDLVLLSSAWLPFFERRDPVFRWIKQNYVFYPDAYVPPGYQIWLRRGSDLQHRVAGSRRFQR